MSPLIRRSGDQITLNHLVARSGLPVHWISDDRRYIYNFEIGEGVHPMVGGPGLAAIHLEDSTLTRDGRRVVVFCWVKNKLDAHLENGFETFRPEVAEFFRLCIRPPRAVGWSGQPSALIRPTGFSHATGGSATIKKMKRHKFNYAYHFLVYLFAFFCLRAVHWTKVKFGPLTVDQIFFHLNFGGEMLLKVDRSLVLSGVKNVLLFPLVLALLALALDIRLSNRADTSDIPVNRLAPSERPPHFALRIARWVAARRAVFLILASSGFLLHSISAFSYIRAQYTQNDYLKENYIHPNSVQIQATRPKNLVLIYVESLEETYSDSALFGKDLLESLHGLGGVNFTHYRQMPGTGWTMAGIVGTQCGIPLKNILGGERYRDEAAPDTLAFNRRVGPSLKSFLPNATCLGDILKEQGYTNVFLGGASLSFAGKGTFFLGHHYDRAMGREELEGAGWSAEDANDWGFLDHQVLARARTELQQLHDAGSRFNLTLLTLDTHGPDGLFSQECRRRGAEDYSDIVHCAADQVAEFVRFIRARGYLKDTNVVVLGDHLAMRNPLYEKLSQSEQRSIFNLFISETPPALNRDTIVHFDLFPTIVEFIGLHVTGDRLGLGYSGLSEAEITIPANRIEQMAAELPNRSELYWSFWKRPGKATGITKATAQ